MINDGWIYFSFLRLLGQFDNAYDKHDIHEMRVNAYASFQLNGGLGCVNAFISKNPGTYKVWKIKLNVGVF